MSRRSSRLVACGYYNSDEDSDSSCVTNISYRENPVKVFKKKVGSRSRTPTRSNSNVSSASTDLPPTPGQYEGLSPSPLSIKTEPTMRTTPYDPTTVTRRAPLTRARSQTPTPSVTPEKSYAGLCSSTRPALHLRPSHKELTQSGVDSSGYSSSEGPNRKLTSPSNPSRISGAFSRLMDSISLMAAASQSKLMHLAALAADTSVSSRMKKACGLVLLLLLLLLCIWFLLPLLTSLFSRMAVTKTPSQTEPKSLYPVLLQEEQQLKQEVMLSQMKERLQLDIQDMKARLQVMGRQMVDYQKDSHSAAASLVLRIQALEAQNAKTINPPVQNHLTPELQQAMEKWLTDRIKEQDAVRLGDKGSCSDCGRPMADKMADFALETQGASVISTRCSETYRIRSACVTLFGFPLWYSAAESPRTVIQGYPVLLPGKCWPFHGVQGTLVISLSHPVTLTHVTLDHLPRCNSPTGRIDSAPKDFEVYGLKNDTDEGTLLGTFTYDEDGESTQTFKLPNPTDVVYRCVELRVLSNWGQVEYTCLYRFRVHGQMASR